MSIFGSFSETVYHFCDMEMKSENIQTIADVILTHIHNIILTHTANSNKIFFIDYT